MTFCALVVLLLTLSPSSRAADPEPFPDLRRDDPAALQEATRVLEEEIKLAARPHTYVLIDLVRRTIEIKSRGLVLHAIPIEQWQASGSARLSGTFRLLARPAVVRRKIDPNAAVEQDPISLGDMPVRYDLAYTPALTVEVLPAAGEHPWHWTLSTGRAWWRRLQQWGTGLIGGPAASAPPSLRLTLSADQARSLAWSLVDGMPLLIRRAALD